MWKVFSLSCGSALLLPGNWPQATSSPSHHQESWWCTCEVPLRFNPDVYYVPGKYPAIADALLGKPLPDQNTDITLDEPVEAHVEAVMSGWPASKTKLDEPNAICGPEKLRRHLIFKSKISGNTFSNMENPETINHNIWICCLLWNMPENKDTSWLAVSHGPEQVKLPVEQVDLNRFFLFISYKQIQKFHNFWSWASDDFDKRQALHINTLIRNAKYVTFSPETLSQIFSWVYEGSK